MARHRRGELRAHRNSTFGVPAGSAGKIRHLPMDDPQFMLTSTASKQQYYSGDLQEDLEPPPLFTSLVDELKIASAIDVPLVVRKRGIGELILGSKRTNYYSPGDYQTIATAAQIATALEQATLYSQTDQSLRQRVEEQLHGDQKRSDPSDPGRNQPRGCQQSQTGRGQQAAAQVIENLGDGKG